MIRLLIFLAIVFLLSLGFVWLVDRPGDVLLTWQGYEIETSLMAAVIALIAIFIALALLVWLVRLILHAPGNVRRALTARKRDRGYRSLTRGMIAVGAGDTDGARRAASEARKLLGDDPLVMLLAAQTAQITGDPSAARSNFEQLADNPDTRILGLHGLFVEAERQAEPAAALHFAEEAHHLAPQIPWAGQAVFDYRARGGDFAGALDTLAANERAGLIARDRAVRLRAVLLTGKAMELEGGEPDEARTAALEACKLAADLVPAAVLAARLLTRAGDLRRATRILETAWKTGPHPDLAEAYAAVRPGDSALDRLARMRKLAALQPGSAESGIAVAHAAIAARDWPLARETLDGLLRAHPSERVCLLMADVEEGEHGDIGRVRAWVARAHYAPPDAVWTADGEVFDAWAPVSPVTGRVDAFEWKPPPAPTPRPRAIDLAGDLAEVAEDVPDAGEAADAPALIAAPADDTEVTEAPTTPAGSDAPTEVEPVTPPPPDDPGPGPLTDDERRGG